MSPPNATPQPDGAQDIPHEDREENDLAKAAGALTVNPGAEHDILEL